MINCLKIPCIIFLCLLINKKSAFSDHSSDIVDVGKKSLTEKIINYSNLEGLKYPKIKKGIKKDHCTKVKYIEAERFKEDGEPIFEENGSINLIIKYFHFKKEFHPIIKFENIEEVVNKNSKRPLKDYTVDKFLKIYFCIDQKERKSIFELNGINNKIKINDDLIKTGLKIPEGMQIQEPYFALASPMIDDGAKKGDKIKPKPDPFKEDLRNQLFTAAKEKLDGFDKKILEIDEMLHLADGRLITLRKDYNNIKKSAENTLDVTFNKNIPEIREKYLQLKELNESQLNDHEIKKIAGQLKKQKDKISGNPAKGIKGLKERKPYTDIKFLKSKFENAKENKDLKRSNEEEYTLDLIEDWESINTKSIEEDIGKAEYAIEVFDKKIQDINLLRQEIDELDVGANKKSTSDLILEYIVYIVIFLFVVAVITFIYLQSRKIKKLSKMSQSTETKFTDMEDKLRSTSAKIRSSTRESRRGERPEQTSEPAEAPKTPQQIKLEKFNDLKRDYDEAKENFSKIAGFKQKWNGVALSRKERQEGSKTVLVSSGRAFEKAEIWCVGFDDKIFAFPGASVYSNMSIYMNLDFAKAQMDFKGVFNISEGSNYSVEPSGLRKGGAGYVVELKGKIQFPR